MAVAVAVVAAGAGMDCPYDGTAFPYGWAAALADTLDRGVNAQIAGRSEKRVPGYVALPLVVASLSTRRVRRTFGQRLLS